MDAPSSYISPETFDQLTVIKGPQTVLWGPGASAGTVRFDRDTPRFTEAGVRFDGSLTGGSFGRNDQTADFTAGNESVYVRVTGNHSHSQDYKDGNACACPPRWDKWNTDLALGFTPDADTLFELTAGTGDGEARYGGRGMDGSKFKRESFGLRFEKRNLGATLEKIEAQLYYNYADHVMDNYKAAPAGPQRLPCRWRWRPTWTAPPGGRAAATPQTGRHTDHDRRAGLPAEPTPWPQRHRHELIPQPVLGKDAEFSNVGLFSELTWRASEHGRLIGGARRRPRLGQGLPSHDGPHDDDAQSHRRRAPRQHATSGFLRYEQDLESLPATWYVGLGHAALPRLLGLFSPGMGLPARSTPST